MITEEALEILMCRRYPDWNLWHDNHKTAARTTVRNELTEIEKDEK